MCYYVPKYTTSDMEMKLKKPVGLSERLLKSAAWPFEAWSCAAAYRMPTSSAGPWHKLVPISNMLSNHVSMAAAVKGTH